MASDIADVLTALATRISTGISTGLKVHPFSPDSIVTPCAIVLPAPGNFVTFDVTFDGKDDFELLVKILVGSEMTKAGQQQLLAFLGRTGSSSIWAAIYGDRTLGGVVADLKVETAGGYGDVEHAGIPYFGAELAVSVWT